MKSIVQARSEELQIDSIERREAPRRRVLKGAFAAYNNRRCTTACTVLNLSTGGARLRFTSSLYIPDNFELIIELDGFEAKCEVVWRLGSDIGVKFVTPPVTASPRRKQVITACSFVKTPSIRRTPQASCERPGTRPQEDSPLKHSGSNAGTCVVDAPQDGLEAYKSQSMFVLITGMQPEITKICVLAGICHHISNSTASFGDHPDRKLLIKYFPRESALLRTASRRIERWFNPTPLHFFFRDFEVAESKAKAATIQFAEHGFRVTADSAKEANSLSDGWKAVCIAGRNMLNEMRNIFYLHGFSAANDEYSEILNYLDDAIDGKIVDESGVEDILFPKWAEERGKLRVPVRSAAVLIRKTSKRQVIIRDVSNTGLGLDAAGDLLSGEEVAIRIGVGWTLSGTVVWCRRDRAAIRLSVPLCGTSPEFKFLLKENEHQELN